MAVRGALEKRISRDTRKGHKSIPAFKIARSHAYHGVESASLSNILQAACGPEAVEI
jgi:hypothetical protein